jgi:hypothetical protein
VPLTREHHARVFVLDRDRDVRERLVVSKADVERRPVSLDQVLLDVQGLRLVAGDDHLDVGDHARQALDLGPRIAALLKVRAYARTKGLRLADVEHAAAGVPEEVHARLRGQALQLLFDGFAHGRIRLSWRR